jgi:FtsP/CotA-like multicopper oxidase with cupredoxin domain
MNKVVIGIIAAVVLVAVGGGAFYAGTKVGENRVMQDPAAFFQQMATRQGGQFPGFGRGAMQNQTGTEQRGGLVAGGTFGTIQKIEGNTITLTTDGESLRVITSDTTFIQKMMDVGTEDLEVGENVIVTGSENDDGSITARSIRSAQGMRVPTTSEQ